MPEPNNDPQFNLEEVVEIAPDDLSNEQKTFLESNVDDLTDDQVATFGLKRTPPPPVEPEVRTKPPAKKDEEPLAPPDDEVDPEDAATIGKVVDKRLRPLQERLEQQSATIQERTDAAEVDELVREKPEFEPYRGRILAYMKHPSYSNVTALNIAKIVAGDDLMKLGAQKERDAAVEAANTKSPGGTSRKPEGGGKDWLNAPKEEFEAERARVMGRQV